MSLQIIKPGSKCDKCGESALFWHPHIGHCCQRHLDEVLSEAEKKPPIAFSLGFTAGWRDRKENTVEAAK